ncbi:fumarylacetoacetate hydrolase family protein [Bosea sp. (in: a-proteobacteria)]|uniref:fumarylacetoacetate hydrolase family protein n=1 Tax=Bosea sp. (in: a-proteobacteria) TaxID=1871050 RepID=UPI00262FF52B|nr:fumarylacetoacetate hydrolase family protein [Bosea sp. (in: a-proteobacteria)]MCO5092691.1 fumarylacetoacetate hydrolase family protein [Bosea sp. (in: a-proteobacteria)]
MKLASLAHGRDGRLVVVSRDLTRATDAFPVVPTLQAALDDWPRHAPRLADLAEGLEHGSVPSFRFHEHDCAAPLPRAYQRLDASATGDEPQLSRGASDAWLGARRPVQARSEGIAFAARIAVATGDVPMAATREEALGLIRLVMLVSDVDLRDRARPSSACSPVAVTPDELGGAWQGGRLRLPVIAEVNGKPEVSADPACDFGALIADAAATRGLSAGTIVTAGPVANRATPLLRFGDTVRIAMKDLSGHSIFGAIEQEVLPLGGGRAGG